MQLTSKRHSWLLTSTVKFATGQIHRLMLKVVKFAVQLSLNVTVQKSFGCEFESVLMVIVHQKRDD